MRRHLTPKLRTRLIALTTLLCIAALLVLGAALIVVQALNIRESTQAEIEYAIHSSNAALRMQFSQLTRIVRDLRNDPSFHMFWNGDGESALTDANERLLYNVDLYSDQNIVSGGEPFLIMVMGYHQDETISCAYYPTTQEAHSQVVSRLKTFRDAFIQTGAQHLIYEAEGQICLFTHLYDLNMEPLGIVSFLINASAVEDQYEALVKYEGACFTLRDENGALLAGREPEGGEYLRAALALPFNMTAEAAVPQEHVARLMRPSLFSMAVVMLLMLPIIALMASAIAYRISKPLRVVADRIGGVEAGDYATRLTLPKWEEFQDIEARFNAMTDTIHHLVTEVYEKQLLVKESEIKFLQSQMNPHFMYNVLTMIAMTAKRNGDDEAYQLLHSFSSLSRGRVFTSSQFMITLRQELELVNYYLFLQCKRYEDRIVYRIDCDHALHEILVPRLCIEPIAENAFLHGMEPKGVGRVTIVAKREGDVLTVTVTDDGVGFLAETQPEGVGISNTRKIIQNVFGAMYGVTVKSQPGAGTVVTVTMPAKGGGAACGA